MMQGKINRGRHTDPPAGRHSIQTNKCPPPLSPHIFYRPDALPATQPTASMHLKASIMNIKAVKYLQIVTNIKTGFECYNFSLFIFCNNRAQVIVRNELCLLLSCNGKLS